MSTFRFAFAALAGSAAFSGAATAQSPARVDSTGTIVGFVVTHDGDSPLAYSVVSAPTLGRERFSNERGAFTFADLPAGSVQLRVRHLGYTPANLTIKVRAGMTDTVRVPLTHIIVRLSTVEVRAYPECTSPGIPKATTDSSFLMIFDQLRQNADQYRLLVETYPFRSSTERTLAHTLVNGVLVTDMVDTVVVDSRTQWHYTPGEVLSQSSRARFGSRTMMLNVPTLVHFADQAFLDNHCFFDGGAETVGGSSLLRIDFIAASRIKEPDVSGSMYLDPTTFQVRRSVIRLSRIPKGLPGLIDVEATTSFADVMSSIPVIAGITSVNRVQANQRVPLATALMNEEQRLVRVDFLKGLPGEDAKKP